MTFICGLDLDMVQMDVLVKFLARMSNGSVVRVQTHKHTNQTNSITSTADAGGNKYIPVQSTLDYSDVRLLNSQAAS